MSNRDKIFNKKNEKWIKLFEKYDPEGVGRIASEDFLIALNTKDFRQNAQVMKKRAALKSKVLEYGTSFITIEEFIQVLNEKPKLSQLLHVHEKPKMYPEYSHYFSGDLYRSHQYHEDLNNRHRQNITKLVHPNEEHRIVMETPHHFQGVFQSPSSNTLPCTSLTPVTIGTSSSFPMEAVIDSHMQLDSHSPLCMHHSAHFPRYDDLQLDYPEYKMQSKSPKPVFSRMIGTVAKYFLSDERDRKFYADVYSCMPPPIFILSITLIELMFFSYYAIINQVEVTTNGPIPIDSLFIYRPDKKSEVWRFILYMVLHAGWLHLIFNLLVQLLVGLPLEMVHGSVRIGTVYMAGVFAGSLATSVFDSEVYLVGASGGVYALLAAHLANVLLNYNQIELGLLRLIGVFIVASVDVGIAIYNRYSSDLHHGSVSYVAHLAGALAGLTIGLLVLKNFEQKLHEQLMWWVALGVYVACIVFALVFNIFY